MKKKCQLWHTKLKAQYSILIILQLCEYSHQYRLFSNSFKPNNKTREIKYFLFNRELILMMIPLKASNVKVTYINDKILIVIII